MLVERDPKVKLAVGVKRAVSLLAQFGTPDAIALLKHFAEESPKTDVGRFAAAAPRAIDRHAKAVNPMLTSGYNRSRGASLIISSNPGRPMPLSVKTIVTIFLSMCSLSAAFGQVADRPSTPPTSAAPPRVDLEQAQVVARLEQHVPQLMKDGGVPGLAIALLRGGEVVWHRGFGVRNSKTKEPVDDATVFEAASLSKPVFAYAVLKLVDGGKFDLNKPLNQYLPGNYDVGDDPRLNQITARHVLSHTTGFPNWRNDKTLKIHFAPGERFSYSGEGFVYLSKVIEHVTGEPFDDFMKRMVFQPLGMTSSSYVWQESYDKLQSFRHNAVGKALDQNKPPPELAKVANAAASLRTTVQDYGRFVAAILQGTGLKPETRKLMLTPEAGVRGGCQFGRSSGSEAAARCVLGAGLGFAGDERRHVVLALG